MYLLIRTTYVLAFCTLFGLQAAQVRASDCALINRNTQTSSPEIFWAALLQSELSCVEKFWYLDTPELGVYDDAHLAKIISASTDVPEPQLEKILLFVRIGFYHLAGNKALKFSKDQQRENLIPLLKKLIVREGFKNLENAATLNEWIILVDTAWLAPQFASELQELLTFFRQQPLSTRDTRQAAYSLFYLYQRAVSEEAMQDKLTPQLVDGLTFFAEQTALVEQHVFVVNNAIWALGAIQYYAPKWQAAAQRALEEVAKKYAFASEPYLWVINALTRRNDCIVGQDQKEICKSKISEVLRKKLFAQQYHYSEPALEIHTSLSSQDMQGLVEAAKKVKKNFLALTQLKKPLAGDPNAQLKVYVYASKADYERYHSFLFNLPTNNGGIYIEQTGTFYTYQRLASESTYSLTELFKHEFVHYLVGRYLVPGMWGESEIYSNHRMVWFDEGLAELLVGGNDGLPTLKRAGLVQKIRPGHALADVQRILSVSYQSEEAFYSYAAVFIQVLRRTQPKVLQKMFAHLHAGDVKNFDLILNSLKKDQILNQHFVNELEILSRTTLASKSS